MAWLQILHTAYRQEEFMPLLLTVDEEDRHEEDIIDEHIMRVPSF